MLFLPVELQPQRAMHRRPHFPSLRQLRAFEAVARNKSIGVGAKELGLSQPAVTQMLTQLETVLAVTLLERRRNGSFPTPLGSVLLPRVQRLFAHVQSALRDPVVGASLSGRETTKSVENKITAHPLADRGHGMRFVRGGRAQAQDIPAVAASVGSRSRARGS